MHIHLQMLPWAYPSSHPQRHLDKFSRFCTAHGRGSLYFRHPMGRSFLPKFFLRMQRLVDSLRRLSKQLIFVKRSKFR